MNGDLRNWQELGKEKTTATKASWQNWQRRNRKNGTAKTHQGHGCSQHRWGCCVCCGRGHQGQNEARGSENYVKEFNGMKNDEEFPSWLTRLRIQLASMRMQVLPLASLSGLRIQRCHKLQQRLQVRLRSHVAVAVVSASSCSFCSTPSSLGTWNAAGVTLKSEKKNFLRQKKNMTEEWEFSMK